MLLLTMVVYGREVASLATKLVVQTEALDAGRATGGYYTSMCGLTG
jgi:hypothetical protein